MDGHYDSIKRIPPQYYVNVQDTARLHVIALANPTVKDERVFAFMVSFNFNDIIDVLRRQYPGKERWVEVPDQGQDLSKIDPIKRAEELLEEAYGFYFTGLEQSVKDNVVGSKT